jgi:hypothetical protein
MNLFIFIAETQPIFGASQSSASGEQYKMNLFISIAEMQPIFGCKPSLTQPSQIQSSFILLFVPSE